MKFNRLIRKHLRPGEEDHPYTDDCLQQLIEYRALEADNQLNKQLLKELVLKYSAAERELVRLNNELLEKQQRLDQDLKAAAGIQRTLLPSKLPESNHLRAAWKFIPCEHIGGDIFNLFPLDEDHLAVYMIDVSGHGVPAALVTVSVSQALHPDGGYVLKKPSAPAVSRQIAAPRDVLSGLDEQYPIERFDMFFTMNYGIVNTREGILQYANAGHPPAILVHPAGGIEILEAKGPVIGMGGIPFEQQQTNIAPGDKVIFYTDGIIEYENAAQLFYGKERFYRLLEKSCREPLSTLMERIIESLRDFAEDTAPQDDISLLAFEYLGGT